MSLSLKKISLFFIRFTPYWRELYDAELRLGHEDSRAKELADEMYWEVLA